MKLSFFELLIAWITKRAEFADAGMTVSSVRTKEPFPGASSASVKRPSRVTMSWRLIKLTGLSVSPLRMRNALNWSATSVPVELSITVRFPVKRISGCSVRSIFDDVMV